jgi:Cu2+-exporting ATPase
MAICSGDSEPTVREIADRLGIKSYKYRQKPEDKIRFINELKGIDRNVLMVGDGVNDAPVLAAASVSMTVSGASELANSAADFILTGNSLRGLASSFKAAQKAHLLVKQNLSWALMYNLGVLPLAVSGLLQPWMAALGMSASSLVVVLNATRMSRQVPGSGNLASLNRPVAASQ